MRINSNGSGPTQRVGSSGNLAATSKTAAFSPALGAKSSADAPKLSPSSEFLEDVKSLAVLMRDGDLTKEEAAKKFADLVMEKRHDMSLFGKKADVISKAVQEIVGQDPEFSQRLHVQLQRLSQNT